MSRLKENPTKNNFEYISFLLSNLINKIDNMESD